MPVLCQLIPADCTGSGGSLNNFTFKTWRGRMQHCQCCTRSDPGMPELHCPVWMLLEVVSATNNDMEPPIIGAVLLPSHAVSCYACQVAEVVESLGARPLSSFRMALQGQCKALLDASHARCMTQLQGLLEAEQWVAVDVPAGFQVRNIVFIGSLKMGLLGLGYVGGGVSL